MTVYWKTGNDTHLVPIPQQSKRAKMEFKREMKGVSLLLQTRLTLHDLDEDSVGSYFCVGDVQVRTARNTIVSSGTLMNKEIELQKGEHFKIQKGEIVAFKNLEIWKKKFNLFLHDNSIWCERFVIYVSSILKH